MRHLFMCLCTLMLLASNKSEAFLSTLIEGPEMVRQRDQVLPCIINELLPPDERQAYSEISERGCQLIYTDAGHVRYEYLADKTEFALVSLVTCESLHHDKLHEKTPYQCIDDWFNKYKEELISQNTKALQHEFKLIRHGKNEVVFVLNTWNRIDKEMRKEWVDRAVLFKGRVYHASYVANSYYDNYRTEDWIKRLENISYFNKLVSLADQPENQVSQTSKSGRRGHRERRG